MRGVRRSSSWEVPLSLSSNFFPLRLLLGVPEKFISASPIDPGLISELVEDGASPAGMSGGGKDDKIA